MLPLSPAHPLDQPAPPLVSSCSLQGQSAVVGLLLNPRCVASPLPFRLHLSTPNITAVLPCTPLPSSGDHSAVTTVADDLAAAADGAFAPGLPYGHEVARRVRNDL